MSTIKIKVKYEKDCNEWVAFCDEYDSIIGVGDTRAEAIDNFKISLREYLNYIKEFGLDA